MVNQSIHKVPYVYHDTMMPLRHGDVEMTRKAVVANAESRRDSGKLSESVGFGEKAMCKHHGNSSYHPPKATPPTKRTTTKRKFQII